MRRLVCVVWHDAHAGGETWMHLDDHRDKDPYVVSSVGFLLEEDRGGKPGHTSITQSWSEDDAIDSVLHVPDAMVKGVYELRGGPGDDESGNNKTPKRGRRKDH